MDTLKLLHQLSPKDDSLLQELASVTIRHDALKGSAGPAIFRRDREALELLKRAAASDKASSSQLDMTFHALMEAQPQPLQDANAALLIAERGVTLTHGKDASWLLSLAEAQRALRESTQASLSAKAGLRLLPNEASERNSRLRKLLEFQASVDH
jgi:hypothetical protein